MRPLTLFIFFLLASLAARGQAGVYLTNTGRFLDTTEYDQFLPDAFDLFNRDQPLKITLESDFKNLYRKKNKEQYQEALITIPVDGTVEVREAIRIKPRGNFRLKTCDNPPIMLNFKKGHFPVKNLQNLNKVKLVHACKSGEAYENFLFREYLAYKFYNQLTDHSFQVALLEIEFVDTGRDNKTETHYGFLIEDGDAMGERTGLRYLDDRGVLPENTEPFHAAEMAVFQYMIGNTDWSIKGKHNVKLLVGDVAKDEIYAVPYDFDYCGLVNAPYAVPPEFLEISRVTERLFRSYCSTAEEFDRAFKKFREKKDTFYGIVNNFSMLPESERKDILAYLDDFYDTINSPKNLERTILKECRPRESRD